MVNRVENKNKKGDFVQQSATVWSHLWISFENNSRAVLLNIEGIRTLKMLINSTGGDTKWPLTTEIYDLFWPHVLLSPLLQYFTVILWNLNKLNHVFMAETSSLLGHSPVPNGSNSIPCVNYYSWNLRWSQPVSHTHTNAFNECLLCDVGELGSVILQSLPRCCSTTSLKHLKCRLNRENLRTKL